MACLYSLTVPWMRTSCKNLEDRSVSPKYRQIALLGLGGRMNRKHPEQKEPGSKMFKCRLKRQLVTTRHITKDAFIQQHPPQQLTKLDFDCGAKLSQVKISCMDADPTADDYKHFGPVTGLIHLTHPKGPNSECEGCSASAN